MVYIYVLSIYIRIHAIYEDDETYIPYDDTTIMWQNVSCTEYAHNSYPYVFFSSFDQNSYSGICNKSGGDPP